MDLPPSPRPRRQILRESARAPDPLAGADRRSQIE
jgi:hypothetical protein